MTKIWFSKEAVVKVALASAITIDQSGVLDSDFSSAVAMTGVIKDLRIVEPMPKVEKIDLAGTSNYYQNAELEEKPANMAEISGTLVLPGDEVVESLFYSAGSAIGGTHTRYFTGYANIRKLAFLVNLDDGLDEVNIAMTNVVVNARETRLTGADGHWETNFTGMCLPRDFHGPEFKD